jgi:hypothetical protein
VGHGSASRHLLSSRKKPGGEAGLFYADTLVFHPCTNKSRARSGARSLWQPGRLGGLLVGDIRHRNVGDVSLLPVMEAPAKGKDGGDNRKGNNGAHD